jgi:hypothetical protein
MYIQRLEWITLVRQYLVSKGLFRFLHDLQITIIFAAKSIDYICLSVNL